MTGHPLSRNSDTAVVICPPGQEWLTLAEALGHLPPHIPENDLRFAEHHFEDGRVIFDHAGLHGYIAERPAPDPDPERWP